MRNETLQKTAEDYRQRPVEDGVRANIQFASPLGDDWHGESSSSNQIFHQLFRTYRESITEAE